MGLWIRCYIFEAIVKSHLYPSYHQNRHQDRRRHVFHHYHGPKVKPMGLHFLVQSY